MSSESISLPGRLGHVNRVSYYCHSRNRKTPPAIRSAPINILISRQSRKPFQCRFTHWRSKLSTHPRAYFINIKKSTTRTPEECQTTQRSTGIWIYQRNSDLNELQLYMSHHPIIQAYLHAGLDGFVIFTSNRWRFLFSTHFFNESH